MAHTVPCADFWLPPEFLTDDDKLMDKENFGKSGFKPASKLDVCFPSDFACDFGLFGSPVGSTVSSAESDEDLLAGLTRKLARSTLQETQKITRNSQNTEKTWVLSCSPQSTLSWSSRNAVSSHGSPNGPSQVSSPPTTPLGPSNNEAWDLIYAAAGQVARMKMSGEGPPEDGGFFKPRRCHISVNSSPPVKSPATHFYTNQCFSRNRLLAGHFHQARQELDVKQQVSSIWGRPAKEGFFPQNLSQKTAERGGNGGGFESNERGGRPLGLPQSAWPPLQVQPQHQNRNRNQNQNQPHRHSGSGMTAVFLGGSGVKRKCAGTGVFLPRRYGNVSDTRGKPACSTALLPARVVHALNKNLDDVNVHGQPQHGDDGSLSYAYDALVARRNALLAQQKRNFRPEGTMNHEICLPQEWTY